MIGERLAILAAALLFLAPLRAAGWGTEEAHWQLANLAIERADSSGEIDAYLHDQLDLRDGRKSGLILNLGFDPGGIDSEIGQASDSRLNRSQNLLPDRFKVSFAEVHIEFGAPSAVMQFIRAGVWAEDNPNARARHHFHDPTFAHDPPSGNHGLDDQKQCAAAQAHAARRSFERWKGTSSEREHSKAPSVSASSRWPRRSASARRGMRALRSRARKARLSSPARACT